MWVVRWFVFDFGVEVREWGRVRDYEGEEGGCLGEFGYIWARFDGDGMWPEGPSEYSGCRFWVALCGCEELCRP